MKFQMFKLHLERQRNQRSSCQHYWIIEKATEFQKNIYFYFIYWGKAFDCVDHNKLWKILEERGIPDHFTCLLRNLHLKKVKKQQLGLDMEQQTGSK